MARWKAVKLEFSHTYTQVVPEKKMVENQTKNEI